MQERQSNTNLGLFRIIFGGLRLRAKIATDGLFNDARYRIVVPPERHRMTSEMSEIFAGEALDFIKDNPSDRLKPLQPTKEQLAVVYFLLDSVENGSLVLKKTQGMVRRGTGLPYLVKEYMNIQAQEEGGDLGSRLVDPYSKKEVFFIIRWDVNKEFPLGFTIFGNIGLSLPKPMDFLTLPQKAETPSQVSEYLGFRANKGSSMGVYQNGERIVINREDLYQGRLYRRTDQYYLVGSFDGESTKKTYWVYGMSLDRHHQVTVRESAGARQFAPENNKA